MAASQRFKDIIKFTEKTMKNPKVEAEAYREIEKAVYKNSKLMDKLTAPLSKTQTVNQIPHTLPPTLNNIPLKSGYTSQKSSSFLDEISDSGVKEFRRRESGLNSTFKTKTTIPNAPTASLGNANRVVFGNGTFGTHSPVMDNLVSRVAGNTSSKTNRVLNSSVQPKRIVTKQYGPRTASNPSANRVPTNKELINGVKPGESFLGSIGATTGALTNSFMKNIGEAGVFSHALKGTVQSSALGGVAGGTLSYLQGNDPWEGAKTGMVRGALIGGGYQGLKVATYSRSAGKGLTGIKSNLKQIGRGVNQTYQAHTVDGLAAMRQNGKMSNQLKKILMANQDSKIAEQVLLK